MIAFKTKIFCQYSLIIKKICSALIVIILNNSPKEYIYKVISFMFHTNHGMKRDNEWGIVDLL
jgi:hypothetical protein